MLKPSVSNYNAIDLIIKRCAKFVFNLSKFDSVSGLISSSLKWLFAKFLYKCDILKIAYKMYNNIGPEYFINYLNIG